MLRTFGINASRRAQGRVLDGRLSALNNRHCYFKTSCEQTRVLFWAVQGNRRSCYYRYEDKSDGLTLYMENGLRVTELLNRLDPIHQILRLSLQGIALSLEKEYDLNYS